MPIYEYECKQCSSQFELLIRGEEVPECPGCGSRKLDKLLSAAVAHTAGVTQLPVCQPGSHGCCGELPDCGAAGCPMQ